MIFKKVGEGRPYPEHNTSQRAWSVIAPRMNQRQAARIKQAMARQLGKRVELLGRVHQRCHRLRVAHIARPADRR